MPRYVFHDPGNSLLHDAVSIELPDRVAAREAGIRLIGSALAERPELLDGSRHVQLLVTTENSTTVTTVVMNAIEAH